jgi:hypothetical protein
MHASCAGSFWISSGGIPCAVRNFDLCSLTPFAMDHRVSFRRKKKDEKDAKPGKEDAKPTAEPKKPAATKEEKKVRFDLRSIHVCDESRITRNRSQMDGITQQR